MEAGGRVARVSDHTCHVAGRPPTGRLMYRAGDVLCSIERTLESWRAVTSGVLSIH